MQAELQNEETGFVANIPILIQQAESKIYNRVRTPDQRSSSTGSLSIGVNTISISASGIEPIQFVIADSNFPLLKDESFIRTIFPGITGTPKYYAISAATSAATSLLLGPTPDAALSYLFRYFKSPESIVTASETWLSTVFPDVLLNACLVEGEKYDKGPKENFERYQTEFAQGMDRLIRSAETLMMKEEYRTGEVTN